MSLTHAQRLHIRLFLEGVEVPVISAQVQATANGPIVASVQIPPLPEATRLMPRTLVHLFFLDMSGVENTRYVDESLGGSPAADAERAAQVDSKNWLYKLLFVGEVMGFQWTKAARGRSVVLQCSDLSNYWDYAFQFQNNDIMGPGVKAVFSGGATNLFTDKCGIVSKGSVLTQLVTAGKCNSFPNLKGLAAGLIRLVEMIGGTYFPKPGTDCKRIAGQNLFFSVAELRLRITHLMGTVEKDPTANRVLNRSGYGGMFDRALSGMGEQTSVRSAMNALSKVIFYETYPQPCPLYIPGSDGEVEGAKKVKLKGHKQLGFIAAAAEGCVASLTITLKALAIFDNTVNTREGVNLLVTSVMGAISSITKILPQTRRAPDMVRSVLSTAVQKLKTSVAKLKLIRPKSPASSRSAVASNISDAIEQLKRIVDLTFVEKAAKDITPARLLQQLIRPDVWFTAPPRCNVLFPDMYTQFSYQRMFMQEPTRLLLKTNSEIIGEEGLMDKFYIAPQASTTSKSHAQLMDMLKREMLDHELFTGILPVFEKMGEFNTFAAQAGEGSGGSGGGGGGAGYARALAVKARQLANSVTAAATAEVYNNSAIAGVAVQSANAANAKAAAAEKAAAAAYKVESKASSTDPKSSDIKKVSFAQRSTNFLYFKYRFSARQASVSARFNPYIAIGFPGLVIDKYIDANTIALRNDLLAKAGLPAQKISEVLGTNYLGNFTQVAHTISNEPERGSTEIAMTFCRQAEESVEFLGALDTLKRVKTREGVDAKRSTKIAALHPPKLFSLGPNMGRISAVADITAQYAANVTRHFNELTDKPGIAMKSVRYDLPLFDADISRATTNNMNIRVPIGIAISAVTSGIAEIENITGDPEREIVFSAYQVDEEIPRYRTEEVAIPTEELVRPGWYDKIWSAGGVGAVYKELLDSGSICEAQRVTSPNSGASTGVDPVYDKTLVEDATDPRYYAPTAVELGEGASIQQAVEYLVLAYSYIKQAGMDIEEFINAYTFRPIANMVDMFGTADLVFSADGMNVVSGIEGFHSRAFGPYSNLFGLLGPEVEDFLGIARGTPAAEKVDTRGRKYSAVLEYVTALRYSRALLG